MKKLTYIILAITLTTGILISCKKKKEDTPAPSTPAPTATNVTFKLAIGDFTSCAGSVVNPKVITVAVSPSGTLGDTVSVLPITVWFPTSAGYSMPMTDSTAIAVFTAYPSATITYPLLPDGSYYRVYIYDGTTLKCTIRVYNSDGGVTLDSGFPPFVDQLVYHPKLAVIGW